MKYSHNKVVIGVPIYNESQFIRATLDSLTAQTYDNFLVLIADNSSNDGSSEICREFVKKDNRFIYYCHKSNIGSCENFQFIYENSNSQYLMWLGGHDLIAPEYLETQIKILDSNPDIVLAYSRVNRIDELGNIIRESSGGEFVYTDDSGLTRYLKTASGPVTEATAVNGIFRRTALRGMKFYKFYGPDLFLLTKAQFYGKFYRTEKPIYLRRCFNTRDSDYLERITGKIAKRKIKTSLSNPFPLVFAQIADFISLEIALKDKIINLPKLIYGLFMARILNDLLMKAIPTYIIANILSIIPRRVKDYFKPLLMRI